MVGAAENWGAQAPPERVAAPPLQPVVAVVTQCCQIPPVFQETSPSSFGDQILTMAVVCLRPSGQGSVWETAEQPSRRILHPLRGLTSSGFYVRQERSFDHVEATVMLGCLAQGLHLKSSRICEAAL